MKQLLLVQFAKWPVAGKVKTRLAKTIGDTHALEVHVSLLETVFTNLVSARLGDIELWLNEYHLHDVDILGTVKNEMKRHHIAHRLQCEGSLGQKMADCFQQMLTEYHKVIIVGSDCPTVDVDYLSEASECLNTHDLVLGPAEDGGYVLIGATRFDPEVFQGVEWGQNKVLETTLSNAKNLSLIYSLLNKTWDVDDMADYQRWLNCRDHNGTNIV